LVSLNAVRKSFGSRTVLDGLDFAIEPGARVGVVGANGSGKSTCPGSSPGSEELPTRHLRAPPGSVISFLPQHPLGDERNALETVRAARPDLDELDRELHRISDQLATPELAADLDKMSRVLRRQEELVDRWEEAGGPSVDGRGRATLLDLGLEEADLTLATSALSGGQRKLIALAACLAQDPDVLLLDEPEAHLDAVGRSLLERLISAFDGAVVSVSHDRYLLDETVSQIAELHSGRIRMWPGNYSAYTLARELELQRQQQQFVTQQKEIERLEEAIRRFKLWASWVPDQRNIRQARNKQRQIDSMEKVERPVLERRKIALRLHPHERGGQRVFELRHVGMQFGEDVVLADVELTAMHGERVGFAGANGAGKSVLLKTVVGELSRPWARSSAVDPDRLPRAATRDARSGIQPVDTAPGSRTAAPRARPWHC
jgi:ATP-binding cassette subfamily F protein 3